jgi:hypothetical protein
MMQSPKYNVAIADEPEGHYHSGKLLMNRFSLLRKNPSLEDDADHAVFFTIDDLLKKATELVEGLNKLGEQKHPLSVRRGVKNVFQQENKGEILKAVSKTYFFDIKQTREGKPYLMITESRIKGQDQKPERSSIIVFQENMSEFAQVVTKMAENFTQGN